MSMHNFQIAATIFVLFLYSKGLIGGKFNFNFIRIQKRYVPDYLFFVFFRTFEALIFVKIQQSLRNLNMSLRTTVLLNNSSNCHLVRYKFFKEMKNNVWLSVVFKMCYMNIIKNKRLPR